MQGPCTITIIVSSLTLFEGATLLEMDNIKQLFVSYKFLDCDPEQLETPISLPKPKANRSISYNFKKGAYMIVMLISHCVTFHQNQSTFAFD